MNLTAYTVGRLAVGCLEALGHNLREFTLRHHANSSSWSTLPKRDTPTQSAQNKIDIFHALALPAISFRRDSAGQPNSPVTP
jgi:hypothetical protein